jgi:hypothetical protein
VVRSQQSTSVSPTPFERLGTPRPNRRLRARRWEALLLVMDNRPFPDLRHVVRYNDDSRVHVFAEWVSGGGGEAVVWGSSCWCEAGLPGRKGGGGGRE